MILINLDGSEQSFELGFRENESPTGTIESLRAADLASTALIASKRSPLRSDLTGAFHLRLPAHSMSLLEVVPRA